MSDRGGVSGRELHALVEELYPICRSLTGDGVRATLAAIGRRLPLEVHEVPSGTRVLDWTVPDEWNVRDAWIADPSGTRVVDFRETNLHLVGYSVPVRERLSLAELRARLHTLPDRPDLIPYRTSYYEKSWGFCLSENRLRTLTEGDYEVCVDSTLAPGALTYGEAVLPGETADEILISAHVCHPSLGNDNLSGIAVATWLGRALADTAARRSHTVRILFAPGTIGAITWLSRNRDRVGRIRHGLTLTNLGDGNPLTYKRTLGGDARIDRAASHVLAQRGLPFRVIDYTPDGYDERQYNSPGFRLPVGSLMRARPGELPEYHTSGDDPSLVSPERLAESLDVCREIVDLLDGDRTYRNLAPEGEPQLGRRGLYRAIGGTAVDGLELAMLWVLTLSDGSCSLLDVSERAGLPFAAVRTAAEALLAHGLLSLVPEQKA